MLFTLHANYYLHCFLSFCETASDLLSVLIKWSTDSITTAFFLFFSCESTLLRYGEISSSPAGRSREAEQYKYAVVSGKQN